MAGQPLAERIRRRAEYVGVRVLHGLLGQLPLAVSYRIAEAGLLAFYRVSRYRRRALESLETAFGQTHSEEERRAILWRSVRYQAWFFLDVLLAPALVSDPRHGQDIDLEAMEAARREHDEKHPGLGAILLTGHLGTPEVGSLAAARAFWPHMGLARRLDNRLIWNWFLAQREGFARPTVDRSGVLRRALRHLKAGGSVGMLNDQNAGPGGEFVPFFGRLASTHAGAAALAFHSGAPIYVMFVIRTRPRAFAARITVRGPYFADPQADRRAEIHRLTAVCTAEIEAMTRRHPEQALWAHRRWKTRPPEEEEPSP